MHILVRPKTVPIGNCQPLERRCRRRRLLFPKRFVDGIRFIRVEVRLVIMFTSQAAYLLSLYGTQQQQRSTSRLPPATKVDICRHLRFLQQPVRGVDFQSGETIDSPTQPSYPPRLLILFLSLLYLSPFIYSLYHNILKNKHKKPRIFRSGDEIFI